jgi:Putative zinc-finger
VKTHNQISEETIERYVRHELADDERRIFEEHLLECPECFEEVQLMERFVAGVRHAGRTGLLTEPASDRRMPWLMPALAAGLAAVLIAAGAWIATLHRSLNESLQARDALANQLAQARLAPVQPVEMATGNLPIAVLKADRAAGGESILQMPAATRAVALWMDVEPGSRYRTFALSVLAEAGTTIETLTGLTRNSDGAVAVILPAAKLPAGRYTVQLSSEAPPRLLAQYNLRIASK